MAYEIELINGVTKRENLGVYFYYFPKATVKVNVTNPVIDNQVIEIRQIDNFPNFISTTYGDITDKLGSSNAVEYVDYLANNSYFFGQGAEYLPISLYSNNTVFLGLNPTLINFDNLAVNKVSADIDQNLTINVSNTLNQGVYNILFQKKVAGNVELQVNQMLLTTIYNNELTKLTFIGSLDSYFFVTLQRVNGILYVYQKNTSAGGIIDATDVAVDDSSFEVIQSPANLQDYLNQNDTALLNARSTGLRFGGNLTDLGAGIIQIDAGAGQILDNTDPSMPSYTSVTFVQQSVDLSASNGINYLYIDSLGVLNATTVAPQSFDFRLNIYLWRISIIGGVFSAAGSILNTSQQLASAINDIWEALGILKKGLQIGAASTDLSISIAAGNLYENNANFYMSSIDPNRIAFGLRSPATFRRVTQSGAQSGDVTLLDVANYDVADVITPISGAASRSTIQIVFIFPSAAGNLRILYGQEVFTTLTDALDAVRNGTYQPIIPAAYSNAIILGYFIVQKGATNLADGVQLFISTNRFGLI